MDFHWDWVTIWVFFRWNSLQCIHLKSAQSTRMLKSDLYSETLDLLGHYRSQLVPKTI